MDELFEQQKQQRSKVRWRKWTKVKSGEVGEVNVRTSASWKSAGWNTGEAVKHEGSDSEVSAVTVATAVTWFRLVQWVPWSWDASSSQRPPGCRPPSYRLHVFQCGCAGEKNGQKGLRDCLFLSGITCVGSVGRRCLRLKEIDLHHPHLLIPTIRI